MNGVTNITEFIARLTRDMGVPCEVSVAENGKGPIAITLAAEEGSHALIGKGGQTLRALEHLVRLAWLRSGEERSLTLDINEYRRLRTEELQDRIKKVAERVRMTKKAETLDPMTSYERRVVHTELASFQDLGTESIGQEPHRRVVIKPL